MDYTTREWWEVAKLATERGLDVVILDPEAEEGDYLWDEVGGHGSIVIVAYSGAGWQLTIGEPEPQIAS